MVTGHLRRNQFRRSSPGQLTDINALKCRRRGALSEDGRFRRSFLKLSIIDIPIFLKEMS